MGAATEPSPWGPAARSTDIQTAVKKMGYERYKLITQVIITPRAVWGGAKPAMMEHLVSAGRKA